MSLPLPIDALRCFAAAARALNFRAAARQVALSPAAFGQRIRQLEDAIAQPLFRRTTRSVVLTEAGLRLVPAADAALRALEDCRRIGSGDTAAVPLELTLGTRHELGMSFLVPLLDELEASVPGLSLHLYVGSGSDLSQRVRAGELDCAVSSSRILDPKLTGLRLHEERYQLVAAPRLLRARPLRNAADARAHTLFDISAELPLFRYFADAPGAIDSLAFARVMRLGTIEAIRQRVLRGHGVAVLPAYFVAPDLRSHRLAPVLPRVRAQADWFRLIIRADDPRRSVFERLAAAMRSHPLR